MDDIYRSQFRLPWHLYLQLRDAAQKSGRSLNSELVHHLTISLSQASSPGGSLGCATTEQIGCILSQFTLSKLLTATELETVSKRLQELLIRDQRSPEQSASGD
uniref:Arc family DNA-binding protein n=1 Tax=Burkholderia arboris TaxID=488730 RepID=UPI003BEEC76C